MRIDKFIGNNTELSRTQIHVAFKKDQIKCNGVLVTKTNSRMNDGDVIELNNTVISAVALRYLLLNKPAGYVCANTDSEHPTVLDLINLPQKASLQIAGRLDVDTTGLVMLTDDGPWNHLVTSPRRSCKKTYFVTTADPINESAITLFTEGVLLHGEDKKTLPAELTILASHKARLDIHEGKYHQVKRMFAALGNKVISLHREKIGMLTLDDDLKPGAYRQLSSLEIASFR